MFKNKKFHYPFLVILLVVVLLIWQAVFERTSDNFLKVTFFDVGQGDAIFIETPNHRQILIDGGPDKTVLEKLGQAMLFYDRTIDLIILTHSDADHVAGLIEVLNYYQVKHILTSGFEQDTAVYHKWRKLISEKNIPLTIVQAGQKVILNKEIILEIFWPEQPMTGIKSANNASVVGRLVYGQTEFLLTGDIDKKIEKILLTRNWNLESDVLKAAHHGSKTSSSDNFIKAVNPQVAIISVGENNRYKHPHLDVLERLKDSVIHRTDKDGDIKISTDGVLFGVETD